MADLPRYPHPESDQGSPHAWRLRAGLALGLVALALIGLVVRALPALVPGGSELAVPVSATSRSPIPEPSVTVTPSATSRAEASPKASPGPSAAGTSAADKVAAKKVAGKKVAARKAAAKKAAANKKAKADKPVVVPTTGPGTYAAAQTHAAPASSAGTLKRYDVRVEHGLGIDPEEAAESIEKVLNDKRSWRGSGRWRFELVRPGEHADLHVYIATPGSTDKLCAPLLTRGEVSCQNGNKVVLNAKRWLLGVSYYGDDVANYRRYLVNHEFGHALGHRHVGCTGSGRLAPVMMQQTKGLGSCGKNPWPFPSSD